ncbi:hypothetical protein M0R04_06925 [Candidatus Dojkabacteria bacterium]|jgi:hypothetical protein|nr:hypothetical protein [Candidatus Dojkabacteria bacterium]
MTPLIQQLNSKQDISKIIKEDGDGGCAMGAVGAGSVAGFAMPMFASMMKRAIPSKPRIIKYSNHKKKKKGTLGIREAFYSITEDVGQANGPGSFNTTDAISKLKSLEDKESVDYRDTATFGLVDSNKNIVRVTIPSDQAQGFEQDIQHVLGDRDESDPAPEIAEILFNLKDRYTIVDVEWPEITSEEEEGQELQGGEQKEEGGLGDLPPGGEGIPGAEGGMPPAPVGGGDVTQVTTLLTQVIDMMTKDAEARKSEYQAKEAEANLRQAQAARDHGMNKVSQEEQYLEMDQYNKAQKEKDKEAKRLAQLSKWKHDMRNNKNQERPAQEPSYDFNPGEEENEETSFRRPQQIRPQQTNKPQVMQGKVSSSDIAKYIASRVK